MALAASQKHRWISILAAEFLVFGNEDKAIIWKKYQEVKQIILTKHDKAVCVRGKVLHSCLVLEVLHECVYAFGALDRKTVKDLVY